MKTRINLFSAPDTDQEEICSMHHEDYTNYKEMFLYFFKEDGKKFGIGSELLARSKNFHNPSWETINFEFTSTKTSA